MASGHVSRANRPNTWLHRPMLLRRKNSLPTRSRPHMADDTGGTIWRVTYSGEKNDKPEGR